MSGRMTDFVWDTEFTEENGVKVLCGTAKDTVTGKIVQIKVEKEAIDKMDRDKGITNA